MKHERLLSIQFARGVAALLVAVYHTSRMMALPQYAGHKGFGGFFEFGYAGVDFFFVLSGFIIYYVHNSDLGKPSSIVRYVWRRLTRIYPSYWLVLAFIVAIAVVKRDPSFTPQHFFLSLFLLPDTAEPMLGVAWTLVHEMLFYSVFALGIFNLRLGIVAGLVWIVLVVSDAMGFPQPVFRYLASPLNLQFLMGIAAAKLVLHGRVPFAKWIACAGLLAFVIAGLAENAGLIGWASTEGHMIFGACATVIIVGIASAERQGELQVGRIGEFFGGLSYLLYLVHILIVGFALQALRLAGIVKALPDLMIVMACVSCAVIVAGVFYRYLDLPMQAVLNRFGRERIFTAKQLRET